LSPAPRYLPSFPTRRSSDLSSLLSLSINSVLDKTASRSFTTTSCPAAESFSRPMAGMFLVTNIFILMSVFAFTVKFAIKDGCAGVAEYVQGTPSAAVNASQGMVDQHISTWYFKAEFDHGRTAGRYQGRLHVLVRLTAYRSLRIHPVEYLAD